VIRRANDAKKAHFDRAGAGRRPPLTIVRRTCQQFVTFAIDLHGNRLIASERLTPAGNPPCVRSAAEVMSMIATHILPLLRPHGLAIECGLHLRRTAAWLGEIGCGFRGHDLLLHFEKNRICLRCPFCGYETAGWTITGGVGRAGLAGRTVLSGRRNTAPTCVNYRPLRVKNSLKNS
jgi:hypothetical protein